MSIRRSSPFPQSFSDSLKGPPGSSPDGMPAPSCAKIPEAGSAIVVDVFSNPRSTPQHLLTAEFYRLVRAKLDDGGSLYVNHTASPGEELFLTRVERTLRSVFADCSSRTTMDFATETGWHAEASMPRNLLFRCRKSALDTDRAVYTDAVPRAELDRSLRLQGRP